MKLQKKIKIKSKLKLALFKSYKGALETGRVASVKDGVAKVNGLFGVLSGEMVRLGISKIKGMVLSLEHKK
jgi:F0F1-type ATP synthase alpha subunit